MTTESELKLQSYMDGELSGRQEREVAAWLAQDAQAQALWNELKMTKTALAGSELEPKLPEAHDFYWNKIKREIQRAEQAQPTPAPGFFTAWRRLLAPLAGVALVAFLTVYSVKMYDGGDDSRHHLAVIENLSEHTGAYSFRSQSEKMFVVWVYDRNEEVDPDAEPVDEQVDQ
jgi:anti-sigma factor RsiW